MKCQPKEVGGLWVCEVCGFTHNRQFKKNCVSAGFGDTISKAANALGIKKCGGCEERRKVLNALLPYGSVEDRIKARRENRETNGLKDGLPIPKMPDLQVVEEQGH